MDQQIQPVPIAGDPKDRHWTPEAIALLGKVPDQSIVDTFGIPHRQVYKKRTALGIPAQQKREMNHKWKPEHVALLGTAPDPVIAKQIGVSAVVVRVKRRAMKIPRFPDPKSAPAVIPQHFVEQFNKLSDGEIARALGYAQATVSSYRRKMGIATTRVQGTLPEEANAFLGTTTDIELAKRYGVSTQCVHKRRHTLGVSRMAAPERPPITAEIIAQFGTRGDKDIALDFRLTVREVLFARNKLGIAPYSRAVNLPEEAIALLGKQTDASIAERFGVSATTIVNVRKQLGVKAYRAGNLPEEAIALLGKQPDSALAKRFGVSTATIFNIRKQHGVEAYRPRKKA